MKDQLIKFLKGKQAVFSVEEINQVIGIVEQLEEKNSKPAQETPKEEKKK